ncbi:MAG: hypothetical protein V7K69_17490 [Nostoc sp.]|uniref:hypothetical protein n=1 Tax=Nostoc sp. TaxID=1180 RepID=UPI002FFA452F
MPRVTVPPNFIGTLGSDALIGEQLNAAPAIGIDILTGGFICTRSGNDTVQGKGAGRIGDIDGSIEGGNAIDIANRGSLNTGNGKDAIADIGNGGNGNTDTSTGNALGAGNDYLKGFGAATVDGGDGFDTLDLSAFNRSQLFVSGVISGNTLNANITFNSNGNSIILSTTGFEKFIFADSSFCYGSLANGA